MVVTIKDLAKKLHVSPATVSLALNDNPAINQETARKVKEAAQSMGCIRNHYARGLPGAAAAPSPWCFRTWKTSTLPR